MYGLHYHDWERVETKVFREDRTGKVDFVESVFVCECGAVTEQRYPTNPS